HPLTKYRTGVTVRCGRAIHVYGQAAIAAEVASLASKLLLCRWREFLVADRDGVNMDGRVGVQFAIFTEPGGKARHTQGVKQRVHIIPEDSIGPMAHDREVHRAATGVCAKGSRDVVSIAALGDGLSGELKFAAI